jgi:hypothetical protein
MEKAIGGRFACTGQTKNCRGRRRRERFGNDAKQMRNPRLRIPSIPRSKARRLTYGRDATLYLLGANCGGGGRAAFDQGDKVPRGGLNAGDIFLRDRRGLTELLADFFEA